MVIQGLMMNIFDEAYLVTLDEVTDKANVLLAKAFPSASSDSVADAISKARALIKYAEHCAEMVRQEKLETPEALKEIKRAHPGFDEGTYTKALNNGFFLTR